MPCECLGQIKHIDSGAVKACCGSGKIFAGCTPVPGKFVTLAWRRLGNTPYVLMSLEAKEPLIDLGDDIYRQVYGDYDQVHPDHPITNLDGVSSISVRVDFDIHTKEVEEVSVRYMTGSWQRVYVGKSLDSASVISGIQWDEDHFDKYAEHSFGGSAYFESYHSNMSLVFSSVRPVNLFNWMLDVSGGASGFVSLTGSVGSLSYFPPSGDVPREVTGVFFGSNEGDDGNPIRVGWARGIGVTSTNDGGTSGNSISRRWFVRVGVGAPARSDGQSEISIGLGVCRYRQSGFDVFPRFYYRNYEGQLSFADSQTWVFAADGWRTHSFSLSASISE